MRGAPQEAFRTYISSNHPLQHEVQLEILSILICSLQLDADGSRWREPVAGADLSAKKWEPNGSRVGTECEWEPKREPYTSIITNHTVLFSNSGAPRFRTSGTY